LTKTVSLSFVVRVLKQLVEVSQTVAAFDKVRGERVDHGNNIFVYWFRLLIRTIKVVIKASTMRIRTTTRMRRFVSVDVKVSCEICGGVAVGADVDEARIGVSVGEKVGVGVDVGWGVDVGSGVDVRVATEVDVGSGVLVSCIVGVDVGSTVSRANSDMRNRSAYPGYSDAGT
jgi:hypothetical protein